VKNAENEQKMYRGLVKLRSEKLHNMYFLQLLLLLLANH
jgi:hypothetical protein